MVYYNIITNRLILSANNDKGEYAYVFPQSIDRNACI